MKDAENHLAVNAVDIILLDLGLPDAQGLKLKSFLEKGAIGRRVAISSNAKRATAASA
jgi:response regulator of citrate/malate metabolism